jgi:hypothetical protein
MFKFLRLFKGIRRGNKLADESAGLCKDIVNWLLERGVQIRLPDTAVILRESYCLFALSMLRIERDDITHAMLFQSQDILKDWLCDVFSKAAENIDHKNSVNELMSTFTPRYKEWAEELMDINQELLGKNMSVWRPAAIDQFVYHVRWYLSEKNYDLPDELDAYLKNNATRRVGNLL